MYEAALVILFICLGCIYCFYVYCEQLLIVSSVYC